MQSLSANAYSLYLLHYVFVVWLQYALLPDDLPAIMKGAIVFGGTLALSWALALIVQRAPIGALLIGAVPPAVAVTRPRFPSPAYLYARLRQFVSQ